MMTDESFWDAFDRLVATSKIVVDRPKGSRHPNFPQMVYPLDYGYLEGTSSVDKGGIDVWLGTSGSRELSAVILTVDLVKRDAEIKLMLGCDKDESQIALKFLDRDSLHAILIPRSKEDE